MIDSNDLFGDIEITAPGEARNTDSSETSEDGNENIETGEFVEVKPSERSEQEDVPNTNENAESDTISDSKYQLLAKELADEGLLELGEDTTIESIDDLKDYFNKTLESKTTKEIDNYKNSFSKEKRKFLGIEDSFNDTSTAINVAKDLSYYEELTNDDLEDVETAKKIYSKYLEAKGFDKEEIEAQIDDAEILDKLSTHAKKALPWLTTTTKKYVEIERDNKIKQGEAYRESQKAVVEKINSTIDEKDYFIKDLPLNKVLKDKIKKSMSEIIHTAEDGRSFTDLGYKQNKNPEEFAIMLNYYNSIGLFNQNSKGEFTPDISKLKNISKTRASSELDKVLNSSTARTGINSSNSSGKTVVDNIADIFKNL